MPSWHCRRMRRAPVAPASAFATSVLPTPASPSTSSGSPSSPARNTDVGQGAVGEVALLAQRLADRVR